MLTLLFIDHQSHSNAGIQTFMLNTTWKVTSQRKAHRKTPTDRQASTVPQPRGAPGCDSGRGRTGSSLHTSTSLSGSDTVCYYSDPYRHTGDKTRDLPSLTIQRYHSISYVHLKEQRYHSIGQVHLKEQRYHSIGQVHPFPLCHVVTQVHI